MKNGRVEKMENCIFCGIVRGELSSYTIFKDEKVTAFLDINPVAMGHILVIPNKHFERLDTINDEEIMKGLMNALIKVSNLLIASGICNDFTILNDNGLNAQQDIMHTHFHIIPRHHNEKIELKLPTDKEVANSETLKYTYSLLKQSL
ncbi:HIT domain-containing protein [Solibacillus sp. NPDC093137]|uniref:HIT domain-containing protein n=1 Tax=Solibacillus sp. NPDC093137 TaxID=3390678 RepID=UPI003D040AB3